jgi:hypothetical protein
MLLWLSLEDLKKLEMESKSLANAMFKINKSDRRVLYVWSEYFVALRIKELHPEWNITVSGAVNSADVLCEKNGNKIKIQVKTGKWESYNFGSDVFCSGDASFGKGTQIRERRFNFLVFLILNETNIRETLVFSIDELNEISPRPNMVRYKETNNCLLSRVESVEKWEKWMKFYGINEPIYNVERDIVDNPSKYVNQWEKIA